MKDPIVKLLLAWLALAFLLIAFAFFFSGCMTPEKATSYLKKEGKLAEVCADEYPVKDSLIQGDTVVVTDTLETFEVFRDTTTVNDTVRITTTLPPKVITKTIRRTDTVYRENTAKLAHAHKTLDEASKLLGECIDVIIRQQTDIKNLRDKWKGKIGFPWWWLVILGLFLFRKPLLKMAGLNFQLFK